jgi:hypothetical protein
VGGGAGRPGPGGGPAEDLGTRAPPLIGVAPGTGHRVHHPVETWVMGDGPGTTAMWSTRGRGVTGLRGIGCSVMPVTVSRSWCPETSTALAMPGGPAT